MLCVPANLIVVGCALDRVPPGTPRSWKVLINVVARALALTPRPHRADSMLCVFVKLIAFEYEFRNRHSQVIMVRHMLSFQPPWIGVEIRTVLTKLLVWGVRGDPVLVSRRYRDHKHSFQQLQWNAHSLSVPFSRSGVQVGVPDA